MSRLYVLTAIAALSVLACSDLVPEDEALVTTRATGQPIINGDPATDPFYDAVVSLHERFGSSVIRSPFCSGTLIAPDVVITAGHCLDVGRRNRPRAMDPEDLAIYFGQDPTVGSATFYVVSETWLHPDYDSRELFNDIALVRLAGDVPSSVATPIPALPPTLGFNSGDVGVTTLNFAGFGDDEHGEYGVKLEADGVLGGLGCTVAGCSGADDPATQISYTQLTSGPCFGDSGGPAFVRRNGTDYVGGLTSWGDSYCTQFGVSTRVDAYQSEIANFVGPQGDVCGDGACTGDETCSSCSGDCGECAFCGDGACDSGEDCSSCSTDCGECPFCGDGACDSGESCSSCSTDCGACPVCGGNKASCSVNSDCCSGNCRNGTCRGN